MKKLSVILCAVLAMAVLAGCESKTIGIIGGADGPTSIYVSEKGNEGNYMSKTEPVRAIMVDGYLFYETGEDFDIVERPVALEERFTKTVDSLELPKNNNESNFDVMSDEDRGYRRNIGGDTIQIPIGDELETFKKLYDPEKDLTQYKYILNVEGDTQYQFGEAEYIVLSNDKKITANQIAKSMLSSNSADQLDIYVVSYEND